MKKQIQSRWLSYTYLLINTICWGAALIIVKPAFEVTTPFRFLMYRYALALPLSLPLLLTYKKHLTFRNIKTISSIELVGTTLSLGLLYAGLSKTSAIEASFLTTTTPIFVVLAGVLLLKEKQEKRETLGLLIAFMGTVALTVVPTLQQNIIMSTPSLLGNLLIIGQNTATAIYFILAKRWYKHLPKLFVTTFSFVIGLVSFFILSLIEAGSLQQLLSLIAYDLQHTAVLWASFYMAVFGSIIGLTAYIKGQDGIEASEASLFWYLQPLVFIPLGMILLDETISLSQLIALATILIGVLIAERRKS